MGNARQGFTLVELLLVISILGLLMAMLLPNLIGGLAPKFGRFRVETWLSSRVHDGLFRLTQGTV